MSAGGGQVGWRALLLRLGQIVRGDWSLFQHDHSTTAQGGPVSGGGGGGSSSSTPVFIFDVPADGDPGPPGRDGIAGAAGAAGAQGPAGPPLFHGEDGEQGDQGPPGPAGAAGATGATGSTGAQGPTGPVIVWPPDVEQGDMGPPGVAGPTGATGSTGSTGAAGPTGPVVFIPPDVEQGDMGPPGPIGPQGATGTTGTTGAQGPVGPVVFFPPDGEAGDQGPPGPRGADGAAGAAGPAGQAGAALMLLVEGEQGEMGMFGLPGPAGAAGASGLSGNTFDDYAHPGATDYDAWFLCGAVTIGPLATGFSGVTLSKNEIYAVPFIAPNHVGVTVDGLGISTSINSGNIRFGIYTDTQGYPGTLVFGSGSSVLGAGDYSISLSQALTPGARYWACINFSSNANTLTGIPDGVCSQAMGYTPVFSAGPTAFVSALSVFGAMPGTFPSGGTTFSAPAPAIWRHYSA